MKPGPLEDVLGGPRTWEEDNVMVRVISDGLEGTYEQYLVYRRN